MSMLRNNVYNVTMHSSLKSPSTIVSLSVPFHFYKCKKVYMLLILGKLKFKTMTEISVHLQLYSIKTKI